MNPEIISAKEGDVNLSRTEQLLLKRISVTKNASMELVALIAKIVLLISAGYLVYLSFQVKKLFLFSDALILLMSLFFINIIERYKNVIRYLLQKNGDQRSDMAVK